MGSTEESNQSEPTSQGRAPPAWKTSAGGVQLAVWRNPAPNGGVFYTVTLDRRFKRQDGKWDSSASLRLNDIPKAILALQKAYERMLLAPETLGEDEEGGEAPLFPPDLRVSPRLG